MNSFLFIFGDDTMEKLTFKNKDGTETEPILIYNTKINKYYPTIESGPFTEEISYLISSSEFFLPDCLIITSSGELYPFGCGPVFQTNEETIFSKKEIRKLFTRELPDLVAEITPECEYTANDGNIYLIPDYNDPDLKINLERIQDYINPSIETTRKEEGYDTKTTHKLEIYHFPEEIRDKIPTIYKDKFLKRIISNIPPKPSISIIYTEKDNEKTLYAEDHDKHKGHISKIIATGEDALKMFDEIKEAKKISCIIPVG